MAYLVGFEDMEMSTSRKQKWMEEEVKKYRDIYDYLSWNPATGEIRIHVIMNIAPPKTYKNKKDFVSQFRKTIGEHVFINGSRMLTVSNIIGEKIEKEWEREREIIANNIKKIENGE